jgi:hypothetical protein
MASSRRTYDTEMITLRQVFAYNQNNSVLPASRVLTTDGRGGTFWAVPSTLGGLPSFNEVIANGTTIAADQPYNRLILSTTDGLGMLRNSVTKEIRLYNKGFTQFDISGGNSLVGYSNNTVTPVVKFEGRGGVRVSSDPLTNTLFIQGVPTAISTAAYAFGQINVISNASTVTPGAIGNSNNTVLSAVGPSSILNIVGVGDIQLYTNTTSNAYYIGISTFTSADYLQLSTIAYNSYASTLSTVSTLFYDTYKISTATSSLKKLIVNVSTGIDSNLTYFKQYVLDNYTTLNYFGLNSTNTGNVITGIQDDINYLYIQIGTIDIGNIRNVSTATGLNTSNLSTMKEYTTTKALYVSTIGVNCNSPQYTVDIKGTLHADSIYGYPSQVNLNSTVGGLGAIGYVSTSYVNSTLTGLGSLGYISTGNLTSTVEGLGSVGYISTGNLTSTVGGLEARGYISTGVLTSTVGGLGAIGYVSTSYVNSTLTGLGSLGYISTGNLVSTTSALESKALSFFSTIPPLPMGPSPPGLGVLGGCNIVLSSVKFTIDSMSTFFQRGATSYIRVSPCFQFDSNVFGDYDVNIFTSLYIDNTLVPNTVFNRRWNHSFTTTKNIYSDTIQIELDNAYMTSNINSTFTVCHEFSRLESAANNYHQTSQTNACSIHFCPPR